MTHSYNRPDFIEIQHKTFQAFLQDDYEFVVFNDAPEQSAKEKIEQTCKRLNIRCVRVPQALHNEKNTPGERHMHGIKYSLEQIGFDHPGIVMLIDSDMFLIQPLRLESFLDGYNIAGELEGRGNDKVEVKYLSPMLAFMNMPNLTNKKNISFDGGYVEGLNCDVGGHTYYYLKNNPSVKPFFFGCLHIGNMKQDNDCNKCTNMTCDHCVKMLKDNRFDENAITFIQACPNTNVEFFMNHTFLHYRGGSNWDGQAAKYHAIKTQALNDFITAITRN